MCPKEAVSDENFKKVHKIILNDRKVKLIEIAEILKISKKCVQKLCAKGLPRLLTIDQNQ
jgi:predicted transcriptional regulator